MDSRLHGKDGFVEGGMDNSNPNVDSLTTLAEASALINSTLDLDSVLEHIVQRAAKVMRAEAASVLTYDRRRNKLVFAAAVVQSAVGEQETALFGQEFDADLGIAGHVLKTRRPELVKDVASHPNFFAGIDERIAYKTRGLIATPMILQDEIVGVVEVLNRTGGGHFHKSDVKLLAIFANLAACGLRNAFRHENLKKENLGLRETILSGIDIIGSSQPVQAMLDLADRVARTNATVLLLGKTGTGKELLAKYIHRASDRSEKAFIGVNCAALSETLLESELFGHEKGAFTGASAKRIGRFELSDNGTLFLDEIGDISASIQIKLLRVLQEREFMRVGGTRTIACDVRIIAATNRDLKKSIENGKFRDDLYYRLNVFPIQMPLLRQRREDIPDLGKHFAHKASVKMGIEEKTIGEETISLLTAYSWPGNIRELANVVERAVLMADGPVILPKHLPSDIAGLGADAVGAGGSNLHSYERAMIIKSLNENNWNQTKAARALGISRDNLRYRLKKYDIYKDKR